MGTKIRTQFGDFGGERKVGTYETEMPSAEADFAMKLLGHFGIISFKEDGEDSAGRRAGRLLTPQEVVARAFDIAEETYRVARERGLMVELPDLNELNAAWDAERAAELAERLAERSRRRSA